MKKILIALATMMVLTGCDTEKIWAYVEYYADDFRTSFTSKGHKEMCEREPQSIFCMPGDVMGGIQPDREYVMDLIAKHSHYYKYTSDDEEHWKYNETITEYLYGDCEDIAMTKVSHMMMMDDIDPQYLILAWKFTSETSAHLFVGVHTSDAGWLHVDYANSGQPIQPFNWAMEMQNPGVKEWTRWTP